MPEETAPKKRGRQKAQASPAAPSQGEMVVSIPLTELHPFPNHPFQVRDDEAMQETAESVKEYGVLVPAIARPLADGGYEIIAGHRRKHACELAGLDEMPVIVRQMDDDAATIIMVDSNLQRENILPSERAKAYKMKLDAIKRQGARTDLTCTQIGDKSDGKKSVQIIAEEAGASKTQIQRYIRLTELLPELLQKVDDGEIGLSPAYQIATLPKDEQALLLDAMEYSQNTPSVSQAQQLKKASQEGTLTQDAARTIMSEEKKPEVDKVTFTTDKLRKYFPKSYTPKRMEETIIKLLEAWMKKRQRDQER